MMNRTILLLAALSLPACLGDTSDSSSGAGLQPNKPVKVLPSTFHPKLISILTDPSSAFEIPAPLPAPRAGEWSEQTASPESWPELGTITLVHVTTNSGRSLEVLDDRGESLCMMTARFRLTGKLAILTDSCGAIDE